MNMYTYMYVEVTCICNVSEDVWCGWMQLPMMLESDAIARYYGLEKGQVVKVSYAGGIPHSLVTYRCVV